MVSCQLSSRGLERSGHGLERGQALGRGDECRGLDRSAADHFRRAQAFAREVAELAAGLARDDDSRGDVVVVLAEQNGGLKAIGGDERLLAAGASQVAKPAGKRAWIDDPEGIGRDADVILIVKLGRVSGLRVSGRRARRRPL